MTLVDVLIVFAPIFQVGIFQGRDSAWGVLQDTTILDRHQATNARVDVPEVEDEPMKQTLSHSATWLQRFFDKSDVFAFFS
jgi:hypothetical protein